MFNPKIFCLLCSILLVFNTHSQSEDSIYINSQISQIKRLINSKNDSAQIVLKDLNEYAIKKENLYGQLKFLFLSGFIEMREGEYENAIKTFQSYINLCKDSINPEAIDQISRIASCYKNLGEYSESEKYYGLANNLAKKGKYTKGIADSFSGVAQIAELKGEYESAMNMYLNIYDLFQKNNDSLGLSTTLNNIGNVMYYQNKFEKAINYYRESGAIDEKMKNYMHLASSYGNLGMIYNVLNISDSALYYDIKCMKILEEMNDIFGLGTIYNNIALVYYDLNEMDEALKYHLKSIAIKEKIGDKNGLATSIINVGNLKVKQKKYKESIEYYLKGLKLAEELHAPVVKMGAHEGLCKAYGELGQYEKALFQHIYYSDTKDSLNNIESKNRISELETKYETKQKQDLIELQKVEIANQNILNKQIETNSKLKTIFLFISVCGLIALSILAFIALVNYRKKQKTNLILMEQKKTIELKNTENELLLGEIHHRVKNNLQVISSLLSLQERDVTDEGVKSAILEGKERVKSMELVHKMLYRENKFSGIEMQDYVNNLSLGLLESFGLNKNDVILNTNFKTITLDVDTAVPLGLILNELIVNSLKHAKKATEKLNLKIEIFQNEKQELSVKLSDNGTGKVSEIEASDSFGLKIVRALIRQLKGVMEITEENGLHYSIELKNYKLIA